MTKYIDADALKIECADKAYPITVTVDREKYGSNGLSIGDIFRAIDKMPAADVEPVRHGEWFRTGEQDMEFQCSICGSFTSSFSEPEYCPHCGAKMDGGSNEL